MSDLDSHATPASLTMWREGTVAYLLENAAVCWPTRDALLWPASDRIESMTWTQVRHLAMAGAARLRAIGKPDEPIAVFAPSSPWWYVTMWAAALSGRPIVPISPALTAPTVKALLSDSGATALITAGRHRGRDLTAVAGEAAADLEHVDGI